MPAPVSRKKQKYTYADYASWSEDERIEIIDGRPFYTYGGLVSEEAPAMQAAPSKAHQEISFELSRQLGNYLKGKPCKAFAAPFAVRLNSDDNDDTTVEPDLVVVCDQTKLNEKGCKGAPDLIIEIISPSTAGKDRITKLNKYRQAGVREYWIVDPDTKTIQVCAFESGLVKGYESGEVAPVGVLPGCEISLSDVFALG